MNAHIDSPVRCLTCKQPIDCQPVFKSLRGEQVALHDACWREIEDRRAERRAFAEARVAHVLASLPKFSVPLGSPDFTQRVSSPRLVVAAQRYRPIERGSLSILGPAGCGKTVTAATIAIRLCSDAVEAYDRSGGRDTDQLDAAARIFWTTAAELCAARRQHRLGEGEAPIIQRAETAPLLVLDEVGQEMADDRWLLELLDMRYANSLPTLSTSGLTKAEIESRYGAGTTRRLVEPKGQFLDLFEDPGATRAG